MNIKKLSIVLLLSMGLTAQADSVTRLGVDCGSCNDSCSTDRCSTGCSIDSCSTDCNNNLAVCDPCNKVSTFFRPRSITTDLTYRNTNSFYNRYHDARCNFFTWDSAFIFTRNRKSRDLGAGFFGRNPVVFAETDGDINSLNFGLGSTAGDGFKSTVALCPRREVFAWLTQLMFNLDVCCVGAWADISFAVESVRHKLGYREVVEQAGTITGQIPGNTTAPLQTVAGALALRNVFAPECKRKTGVDDVMIRLGYDWNYCGNDHVGVSFVGVIPTGKKFDNSLWFQPLVGSKHGAIGVDLSADYTAWTDECNNSEAVLQTELLYLFRLKHRENRAFDFATNGPLSRFLLATTGANTANPVAINDKLVACVDVEPRHEVQWWLNGHWQWCNWGFELSYNLWFRDRERICKAAFDFDNFGIFDMSCGNLTSNSTATVCESVSDRQAHKDATFTAINPANVNLQSGAARKAFSNTVAGSVSYNNVWCECYPWYVSFSGRYEFASKEKRRSTLEGFGVFGKAAISF